MSIITWNCQGAADKQFPSIFKLYVANNKPDIFVLVEPKISEIKSDSVIRKISYKHSHWVETHEFS